MPIHLPTRRSMIQAAASLPLAATPLLAQHAAEAPAARPRKDPWLGLKAGVASYSLRKLPLDAAVAGIRRVGLAYVSIKDFHLALKSTPDQRKSVAQKFRDAGITPLSCGVIALPNDEAQVRNAFEYARDCGIPTLVANPDPVAIELVEKYVKEFDIRIAIHNHGPEDKRFPSPYDAMKLVEGRDPRLGLCIDVGHTARAKVDVPESIRKCRERLYDVHFKDLNTTFPTGRDVEGGRGVLDLKGILQALVEIRFAHHVGIEYEKDGDDPVPGIAETAGYAKGLLAGLTP